MLRDMRYQKQHNKTQYDTVQQDTIELFMKK